MSNQHLKSYNLGLLTDGNLCHFFSHCKSINYDNRKNEVFGFDTVMVRFWYRVIYQPLRSKNLSLFWKRNERLKI